MIGQEQRRGLSAIGYLLERIERLLTGTGTQHPVLLRVTFADVPIHRAEHGDIVVYS